MNSIILYLIQVASVFSILYLIYLVFFNKLTFHHINRLLLLLLVPISIIIPFSNSIFPSISVENNIIPLYEYVNLDSIQEQFLNIEQPATSSLFKFSNLLTILYWVVFSIYILKIVLTIKHLFLLKRKSELIQKNGCQLIMADIPEIFSYFNWIFVPRTKIKYYDKQIFEHEKAHIQLMHSWDVIITELYIAFFWFNPLLYLYRKSLKSVHEFQADNKVLKQKIKPSEYLGLLLETIDTERPNNLLNYFNHPILKKRIDMITKTRSNKLAKLKYLLLIPICAFLILAFTKPTIIKNNDILTVLDVSDIRNNPPSLFPVQNATKSDISSYFGAKANHPKISADVAHKGIDIRAKIGTPIIAPADGMITKASMEGNWGNLIVIVHSDGYETWYAHLHEFNTQENQKVRKGDIIGYVGNTGLSTGPHLHYEVKQHGNHVNPLDYIE